MRMNGRARKIIAPFFSVVALFALSLSPEKVSLAWTTNYVFGEARCLMQAQGVGGLHISYDYDNPDNKLKQTFIYVARLSISDLPHRLAPACSKVAVVSHSQWLRAG